LKQVLDANKTVKGWGESYMETPGGRDGRKKQKILVKWEGPGLFLRGGKKGGGISLHQKRGGKGRGKKVD